MARWARGVAAVLALAVPAAGCSTFDGGSGAPMRSFAPAERAVASEGFVAADRAGDDALSRKVLRSATLTLEVSDREAVGRDLVRAAEESGGFVLSSSLESCTLRVPAGRFDEILESLASLGEVVHRSISGQDVTAEYLDLETRLKAAEEARDKYRALLKKAGTVQEVLEVEKALNEVQERIELFKGRKLLLDDRLALSTVTVRLQERKRPGPLKLVWDGASWLLGKLIYW